MPTILIFFGIAVILIIALNRGFTLPKVFLAIIPFIGLFIVFTLVLSLTLALIQTRVYMPPWSRIFLYIFWVATFIVMIILIMRGKGGKVVFVFVASYIVFAITFSVSVDLIGGHLYHNIFEPIFSEGGGRIIRKPKDFISVGDKVLLYDSSKSRFTSQYIESSKRANQPQDVKIIIILEKRQARTGGYTNGGDALRWVYDLKFINAETWATLESTSIRGSSPPEKISDNEKSGTGTRPDDSEIRTTINEIVDKWIDMLQD